MESKEKLQELKLRLYNPIKNDELQQNYYDVIEKDLDRLEKLDKVIEILKNKPFSFNQSALNMIDNVEEYNSFIKIESDKYTQEEYSILKEVFESEQISIKSKRS